MVDVESDSSNVGMNIEQRSRVSNFVTTKIKVKSIGIIKNDEVSTFSQDTYKTRMTKIQT